MASILKVDDLRGNTSAGDITITSEGGAATQSLQQGLAKVWFQFNGAASTPVYLDSLNGASITDNGTGDYTSNYTNNMNDTNYSFVGMCGGAAIAGGTYVVCSNTLTSSSSKIAICRNDENVTTATDKSQVSGNLTGDLA